MYWLQKSPTLVRREERLSECMVLRRLAVTGPAGKIRGDESLDRATAPEVVVVDNYDSFTFNLVELLERLGARCTVSRNDQGTIDELLARSCDAFVVSPGPCTPRESGLSLALYERALADSARRPILGVCLGHQALATAAGGRVTRAARPMHGKTSLIEHHGRGLLRAAPSSFRAARYNSLIVERASLPACLEVTATSEGDDEIMALRHRSLPLESLQFHPESHWSECGDGLIDAWLADVRSHAARRPVE
jgi:anthranilate synthase/aminodeoxychorismate synthase-like glutamine amidotransferase